MKYIFAAVCLVLLIMNLFMLLVLRQMAKSTGHRIEEDARHLFAGYDELIEKKSECLQELIEETEAVRDEQEQMMSQAGMGLSGGEQPYPSVRIGTAPFQDEDFPKLYRKIKKEFEFGPGMLDQFLEREDRAEPPQDRERRQLIQSVREMLGFDVLYQVSTLLQSRQSEVMKEVLTAKEYGLYQEWETAYPEGDVIGFADWLEAEYAKLDTSVTVRLPEGEAAERDGIHFQTDPTICEGIRIYCKGCLYDYSI